MKYLLRKLVQTRRSLGMAKDLTLNYIDSIKYIASIGAGRWPNRNSLVSIGDCRIPIRWNRTDAVILHEVMRSAYCIKGTPSRILDLGANIGASALYFSRLWPLASIACVEPSAENLALLRRTVNLNRLKVEIFPVAVAIEDGVVDFFVSPDPSSSSLLGKPGWESRTVPALSVHTLMQKLGWSCIDLLKIDIEGYEAELLSHNAAWLAATREITGEAHHAYSTEALTRDLSRYNFAVEILSTSENGGMRIFHASNKSLVGQKLTSQSESSRVRVRQHALAQRFGI